MIIIVKAPQTNSNVTVEKGNIEIHVQLKNKTVLPPKRVKRDLSTYFENSEEEKHDVVLNGKQVNAAKDIIMNYNVPCNQENTIEICRDLVTKFKSIGDNANANVFDGNRNYLSKPIDIGTEAKRDIEELTSTEKPKRQTWPLENIEMIRAMPNIPFHDKERYINKNQGFVHSYPQHLHTSIADNCLLARLLKQNFPSPHSKCFILSYQERSNQDINSAVYLLKKYR